MTRPMPESVTVGPFTYRITDRPEDWDQAKIQEDIKRDHVWGYLWPERSMILVNADNPQQRRVTVLHEVMHLVTFTIGARGKHGEEWWIGRLDAMLLDTLRRNPGLAAWLLDDQDQDVTS